MGKESSVVLIDLLPEAANNGEDHSEWLVETQHDRILFLTLSTTDGSLLDEEQLRSLTVIILYNSTKTLQCLLLLLYVGL